MIVLFFICIVIDSAGRAIKYFRISCYIYYIIGKELNRENYLYYINKIIQTSCKQNFIYIKLNYRIDCSSVYFINELYHIRIYER